METIKNALVDLIAYCQRENVLSADEKIVSELSDILGWSEEDVKDFLY